jgi:hypothetical protein
MLQKSEGFLKEKALERQLKESQIAANTGKPYQQQLETQIKEKQLEALSDPAKKYTDVQNVAAGFAKRSEQAEQELTSILKNYNPSGKQALVDRSLPDKALFNYLKSPEGRQIDQAANNFISAVLRKESGAAISEQEYEREFKKYIPLPGDDDKTIAQKARARVQAIENLKASSGGAVKYFKDAPAPNDQEIVDNAAPWEDFK